MKNDTKINDEKKNSKKLKYCNRLIKSIQSTALYLFKYFFFLNESIQVLVFNFNKNANVNQSVNVYCFNTLSFMHKIGINQIQNFLYLLCISWSEHKPHIHKHTDNHSDSGARRSHVEFWFFYFYRSKCKLIMIEN